VDRDQWAFEAPARFLGNRAIAFGGAFVATVTAFAGNLSATHFPRVPLVTLECATCDLLRGVRLAWFSPAAPVARLGEPALLRLPLLPEHWLRDPENPLLLWRTPLACDLVEVLAGLSRIEVRGDWTLGVETVALEDVGFEAAAKPALPLACAAQWWREG
jgi:hypothetical protein